MQRDSDRSRLRLHSCRNGGRTPRMHNPLWSVPLSPLTATSSRPIFSLSRRPPPRAVVGPRVEPIVVPVAAAPSEPERPSLALIGAVVGDSDAIAVFVDRQTQRVVRLRTGNSHAGWQLDAVMPREVTMKKSRANRSARAAAARRKPGSVFIADAAGADRRRWLLRAVHAARDAEEWRFGRLVASAGQCARMPPDAVDDARLSITDRIIQWQPQQPRAEVVRDG